MAGSVPLRVGSVFYITKGSKRTLSHLHFISESEVLSTDRKSSRIASYRREFIDAISSERLPLFDSAFVFDRI